MLAEQLAHVGDAGAKRIERRLADARALEGDERRRPTRSRGEPRSELSRRPTSTMQRGVLETRLKELGRELPSATSLTNS